jgi:hypothetical protein
VRVMTFNRDRAENLGDLLQVAALVRLLGPSHAVFRDEANPYWEDYGPCVVAGMLFAPFDRDASRILFAGVNYPAHLMDGRMKDWLGRSPWPIGLRDPVSHQRFAERGWKCELIGCPTLTLPRYDGPRSGELLVDVPGRAGGTHDVPAMPFLKKWKLAVEALDRYARASLVTTSRMHVALPCAAMGTPVSYVGPDDDRTSLLRELGIRPGQPSLPDVSHFRDRFLSFLERNLRVKLAPGDFTPPSLPTPKEMRFEAGGGLGDVFMYLYSTNVYELLETLDLDRRATLFLNSHNPFVRELFEWHPRREFLRIHDETPWIASSDPQERRRRGHPTSDQIFHPSGFPSCKPKSLRFYPSPGDLEILERFLPVRPFLLASISASSFERNLPEEIYRTAFEICRKRGVPVVLVGRSYGADRPHREIVLDLPGVTCLVDRLTVPGVARLVQLCSGMLTSHSAMNIVGWYEGAPQFLCYPESTRIAHFVKPNPWAFGRDFPGTDHMLFSAYTPERFGRWLGKFFP